MDRVPVRAQERCGPGGSPEGFVEATVLLVGGASATAGGIARVFEYDGVNWLETAELVAEEGLDVPGVAPVTIADRNLVIVGAPWNSERKEKGGAVRGGAR
ncbi:MAG: hypothetical protein HOP15_07495 [Planctomycetes bacterium]|nr:hypothetical protein [Planctomycetota bacterium]